MCARRDPGRVDGSLPAVSGLDGRAVADPPAALSPPHYRRLSIVVCTIVYTGSMAKLQSSPTVGGSLILLARLKAGLTQHQLADRLGVSQPTIAAYESGRRQPTLHTLMRMLAAAGFDLELGLAPHEDHDEILESLERLRTPAEQRRWRSYQQELVRSAKERVEHRS